MRVRDLWMALATTAVPVIAWSGEPSSAELFLKLAPVFSHPRCANCHPQDAFPRQGDDQHRHLFGIVRGPQDRGAAGAHCTNCHGAANNPTSGVPGAPDWHLAPLKMAWVGLPPAALCKLMTDPARGAMPTEQLIAHLETGLVRWAFEPGTDPHGVPRSKPPMEYQKFLELARAWSASGAACPES